MAKLLSISVAFALLALPSDDAAAVTPDGSNPPGVNGSAGEAPKFIGDGGDSVAGARQAKTASGETGSVVNKAGVKAATAAASSGGRVFLIGSSTAPLAAVKTEKHGKKIPRHAHGRHREIEAVAAAPAKPEPAIPGRDPAAAQPAPADERLLSHSPPSPRVELNGDLRETAIFFLPSMSTRTPGDQVPGAEAPVEFHEPPIIAEGPAPLANALAPLTDLRSAGAGPLARGIGGGLAVNPVGSKAPVIGTLLGSGTRGATFLNSKLPLACCCALAALFLYFLGKGWFHGSEKRPWLSYTEDWVEGFLWRWKWRRGEVTNLRGFCPACSSGLILRSVTSRQSTYPPAELPGTWAFCPKCKEATCLEMRDVLRTVADLLTRKRDSGEYGETVAFSKRNAGVAPRHTVRIKTIGGRIL